MKNNGDTFMDIYVAADHAGFALKQLLLPLLAPYGRVVDVGTHSNESVDYPDFARLVCEGVQGHETARGVLICGTGVGMSIAANRFNGIRAALCHDGGFTARLARQHNVANVLCLGSRLSTLELASASVTLFFETAFEGGRHSRRIEKLETLCE
jgi:ribose 5-phosphate isomerase B